VILSLPTFTLVHVLLSLLGLFAGFVVVGGLMAGVRFDRWTGIFLVTTVLTNATGFGFPFIRLLPSHLVAGLSLVILAVAIIARYPKRLTGAWRSVWVVTTVTALYFNVFVLLAQLFQKIPALIILAPTQKAPVFGVTQAGFLGLFLVLGRAAVTGSKSAKVALPAPL
jgi:hypothetical protein